MTLSEKRIRAGKLMKQWYDALTKCIDEFFEELIEHVPGCVIRYTPILQRPWWIQRAQHFPRWLDHYVTGIINKLYKIKEISMRKLYKQEKLYRPCPSYVDDVMPCLLRNDDTHLSTWGYRMYTMSVFMPLLHKWLEYFARSPALRDPTGFWEAYAAGNE